MQDFRKLQVWQLNRKLTVSVYRATADFPRDERYGLTSQMRRAVISIGSSIAEGCGRGSTADTLRFFQMSFGSSVELLQQLITANDLGFLSDTVFAELDKESEIVRRKLAPAENTVAPEPSQIANGPCFPPLPSCAIRTITPIANQLESMKDPP